MGLFDWFGGRNGRRTEALEREVLELRRSVTSFEAHSSSLVDMAKLLKIDLTGETERFSTAQLEGIAAVFAIIRVLSADLASIPLHLLSTDDSRTERTDLEAYSILQKPSYYHTKTVFWKAFWWNHFLWGAGYAQIIRDKYYRPTELRLWKGNEVGLLVDDTSLAIDVAFSTPNGIVPFRDMIYLPANSLDGIVGRTPIQVVYDAHAEAYAAQRHGKVFYQNGAKLQGILTVPTRLQDAPGNVGKTEKERAENARERLRDNFSGITSTGRVPILEEGIDFKPMNMPMGDMQFIENRQFSFEQLCAIYGVPPAIVQDYKNSRYTNAEQMDLSYVKHTLSPAITQFEEELHSKLVLGEDKPFTEVYGDLDYLLRGDINTQTEHDSKMLDHGVYTQNDILRRMKRPTHKDGDKRWMQAGVMPMDVAEKYYSGGDNKQGNGDTGNKKDNSQQP